MSLTGERRRRCERLAPLVAVIVLAVAAHLLMNLGTGDDSYFAAALDDSSLIDYTVERSYTWTSRWCIEAVLVLVIRVPLLWAAIDVLAIVLIYYSLNVLFNPDRLPSRSWAVALLLFCYPFSAMSTAGWITTTVNYIWVLACGLYVATVLVKTVHGDPLRRFEYVLCILAAVYAANQEQMAVVLFVATASLVVYLAVVRKRCEWLPVIVMSIAILEVIYALYSPGNAARKIDNTEYWFPAFSAMSLPHKVYLGFTDTMDHYLFDGSILYLVFSALLAFCVFARTRRPLPRIVGIVPVSAGLAGNLLKPFVVTLWPSLAQTCLTAPDLQGGAVSVPVFIMQLVVVLALVASIVIVFGRTSDAAMCLSIVTIGLLSRMVMSLSPTLFASAGRTFIFMDCAIVMMVLWVLLRRRDLLSERSWDGLSIALVVLSAGSALNSLAVIHLT